MPKSTQKGNPEPPSQCCCKRQYCHGPKGSKGATGPAGSSCIKCNYINDSSFKSACPSKWKGVNHTKIGSDNVIV